MTPAHHSHHTHMLSPLPTRCFIFWWGAQIKFFALVASLFLLALIKRALVKHASDCLRRAAECMCFAGMVYFGKQPARRRRRRRRALPFG